MNSQFRAGAICALSGVIIGVLFSANGIERAAAQGNQPTAAKWTYFVNHVPQDSNLEKQLNDIAGQGKEIFLMTPHSTDAKGAVAKFIVVSRKSK